METKIYFRDMEGYEALTEHQKKYIGKNAAFDLEKLPARAMQEEMDGFIQERMRKVAITTLQTDKTNYNLLCRFLAEKERGLEHFLDWKRDKWFRKVKAWMLENGVLLYYERQGSYGNTYQLRSNFLKYL